jgi:hypothetical protein
MLFFHSIPQFVSQIISEPSLTVAFGVALILIASCLRHFNWLSRKSAQEPSTTDLGGVETRLGSLADVEFQIPTAALLNSTQQVQSELRH